MLTLASFTCATKIRPPHPWSDARVPAHRPVRLTLDPTQGSTLWATSRAPPWSEGREIIVD